MFKVGDTVIVKENFNEIRWSGDPGIVDDMLDCRGNEFKIVKVYDERLCEGGQLYKIENSRWTWHEKWFDLATKVKEIDESEILSILE